MKFPRPASPIGSTSALARHLGLSRWTISRVLNGHPEVRRETSLRVRRAMDELGFVPSPLGRALRGARTGMVGVCFQAIGSPILVRKIAALQTLLRRAGFRALIELTDGDAVTETEVVRHFLSMKVDGLVVVGGVAPSNAAGIGALARAAGVPLVVVDPLERLPVPTVEVDRAAGMRLALAHLHDLGHRRFALLEISEQVAYGRARRRGLEDAALALGLSWERDFVVLGEAAPSALDYALGTRLAERFFALADRPTAILALNDQIAIGAMAALQRLGLRVPDDVSIVGFDNLEVSAHTTPPLTTVDQHVPELMAAAAALFSGPLAENGDDAPPLRTIVPSLVRRASTGPA